MKKLYKINQFTAAEWDGIEYDWNEHEDEILIIEKKNAYCMDITANGKRIVPILRKIEEAMTAAGLAGESGIFAGWFGEWANELTDRRDRKYFIWDYSGRSDIERGCWSYSWGIEQIDEDRWYIFLNIAKPAEAPQEAHAAEEEQQPTETENAPQAATQAAEGTNEKKGAETMTTTEREALERINARQNAANLFTNIGPEDIAAELAAMEAEQATPAADPDAATLAPADAACVWDEDGNTITPEDITTDEKKEEANTMSNTTKPTATPEAAAILAINPAILRGLHIKIGFDFQQEIIIKRLPAPFTVKAAWKHVDTQNPGIAPATYTAVIIMHDTPGDTWNSRLRMVPITADGIRDDFDKMSYHQYDRQHRYNTIFDDFCRKGDFHDLRKARTCEAWIIAQRKDLLKPWTEPERDWTERQPDMNPGEYVQHSPVYSNRRQTIIIDKSNYRVDNHREDLKRRAAKLRAERQKAAADAATIATAASRYKDLLKAFSAAKQRIITALVNVDPLTLCPAAVTELETIGKAVSEYAWKGLSGAARDINEFAAATRENKFTTPARYDAAYNAIVEKLAAILPEDDGTAKEAV